jgi:uncharacterized protein (TIGR03437 family)
MRRLALIVLGVEMSLAQSGLWEVRARYPIQATEVSGAAIDEFVYSVCGLTAQGSTNRLFRYDPRIDQWLERASVPIAGGADHCNVAAAGGKLYLLGAIRVGTSFVDGSTWEYDPAQDRWERVGQMGTPRGASGVAVVGTNIYVAGGLTAAGSVADFEVFDTVEGRWSTLTRMPTARDHLTAQTVNGRIYAIAGRAAGDLNANEEYEPSTNQWRSRAPIPTARGGLGSANVDGRIQVFGGEGNSGTPEGTFCQNEEYDPPANVWRTLAPMPTPRHGLYGVTVGRRVFVPSGGPRAGAFYSDAHEVFFPAPEQPPRINESGIANAASGQPAIAAGSLVSIFGTGLGPAEQSASTLPLPSQMNGVAVKVDGRQVPILFVAPGQVNFMLPFDTRDAQAIVVSYAGVDSAAARLSPGSFRTDAAPGIFTLSADAQGAVLIGGTNSIAGPRTRPQSRPARRGEVIEIYATGLGAVSDPPAAGSPAASSPLSRTVAATVVMIGGVAAPVLYSGLAPGLAGVYQVNAQVPESAPAGDRVPVTIRVGEQGLSNAVTIAVE